MQRWKPFIGNRIPLGPMSVAPDWFMWLISYGLTTCSTVLVVMETHDQWSLRDTAVALLLVAVNQAAAFLLLLTDPGILPRRAAEDGTTDATVSIPGDSSLGAGAYCRHCCVQRPARCYHCYTCGVCVLQHDHHCHVMGACVGRRSQRWFVSYLLSMVVQLAVGLSFVIRSFRRLPLESDWKQYPAPPEGWTARAVRDFKDAATYALLWHLALMGLIGTLLVPVTAGTLVYVILPFTDTTWREARDGGLFPRGWRQLFECRAVVATVSRTLTNVRRLYSPGPSLLCDTLLRKEKTAKGR